MLQLPQLQLRGKSSPPSSKEELKNRQQSEVLQCFLFIRENNLQSLTNVSCFTEQNVV